MRWRVYWLGQVKKVVHKTARRKLEQEMSEEQIQRERALQRSQLDAIRADSTRESPAEKPTGRRQDRFNAREPFREANLTPSGQIQRERALQRSQLDAISLMISSNPILQSANDVGQTDMVRQQLKMYIE